MKAAIFHLGFADCEFSERVATRLVTVEGDFTPDQALSAIYEADNMPESIRAEYEINHAATFRSRKGRCYTISVGDVVRLGKEYFICLPFGWSKVPRSFFKAMARMWFRRNRPRCFWQDWASTIYKNEVLKVA